MKLSQTTKKQKAVCKSCNQTISDEIGSKNSHPKLPPKKRDQYRGKTGEREKIKINKFEKIIYINKY